MNILKEHLLHQIERVLSNPKGKSNREIAEAILEIPLSKKITVADEQNSAVRMAGLFDILLHVYSGVEEEGKD